MSRPSREQLHIATAVRWAERSVCRRLSVGCVITNLEMDEILGFGYNGPGKGLNHDRCTGESGNCGCLHAEANAATKAGGTPFNKIAFCTDSPCLQCAQVFLNVRVSRVYFLKLYRDESGVELLSKQLGWQNVMTQVYEGSLARWSPWTSKPQA